MYPNKLECLLQSDTSSVSDQIGRNFAVRLLLLEHFLHFYTNEQLQNMVCCTYINIK